MITTKTMSATISILLVICWVIWIVKTIHRAAQEERNPTANPNRYRATILFKTEADEGAVLDELRELQHASQCHNRPIVVEIEQLDQVRDNT